MLRGQTATDKRWEGNGIPQRRFAPTSYTNSPTQYSRTRRGVSPSRGGAFLLRKLTRERAGLRGERVLFRPQAVSVPRVARRDHGCSWEGGPGPPRVPQQDDSGLSGPRDRLGLREHLPIWVCFSFPLRWRPGSPRSACCSGPRRVPRRRLQLPTPPPRTAPSFSGPVTCRPGTPRLLKGKSPSERSGCPASTEREGCPPRAAPRPPCLPNPRLPRRNHSRASTQSWGKPCP